jgi:hypothetical protein
MAKKKLSALVQAMNLFAQLDERDRQTLADYVRSQTQAVRVPKSSKPVPRAEKKLSLKTSGLPAVASTEAETGNASTVEGKGDLCLMCGYEASYQDHFRPSPNYHAFEGKKKASAA